ncbi:MAG TPA: Ig-like domain-containing protein [Spirochaetota bacterium]|nr:Ig-like domain-containing protein [Spirochaetota bacterium]HPR47303.1 Ig-like domain-containing protein [Spirochaetota bacterium]
MKNKLALTLTVFFMLLSSLGLISCSEEAPTVIPDVIKQNIPAGEEGTIFPQIQVIYPGGLQTLDVPASITTGISPNNPGITLIFSKTIENDASELYFSVELLENGTTSLSYTLYPNSTSSNVFSLEPTAGLNENTEYTVRIYDTITENNAPSRTLKFENLVDMNPPATALNPEDTESVDFVFETGQVTPADVTDPTVASTVPADGATGIAVDLGSEYVEIVFDDDSTPMIDPSTVTQSSITLYNVTDSLPVDGTVSLDTTVTNFSTYRFYPEESLDYNKQYRIRMSVAGCIEDMSGNALAQTDHTFTTVTTSTDPTVDNYAVTGATDTTVDLEWSTALESIEHVDLQAASTYTAAEITDHDTTLDTDFSATLSGLTPNSLYSMRIAADNESPGPAGPFDSTTVVNAAFRTLPDTTEGATGDYILSVRNTDKSSIIPVQRDLYESFLIWRDDASDIYGQCIDTSTGAPGAWNQWGADAGSQVFSMDGDIDLVDNGDDGVIAVVADSGGEIYADSIYNNSGTLVRNWAGGPAGLQIYQGSAATPSAALSYSGYVTVIETGNAETNFIYDETTDFSTIINLDAGDYFINEDDASLFTTITSIDSGDDSLIVLGDDIITATSQQYRAGDADTTETATETRASSGTSIYVNDATLDQNDVITNGTEYTYLASGGTVTAFLDYIYTTGVAVTFNVLDSLTTYDYLRNGTANTDTLYDSTQDFSANCAANDLVINTVTGESNFISSITGTNHDLLLLDAGGDFLFDTDGQAYQVLRLADDTTFIASGYTTAIGALTITDTGRDFTAEGAQVGDIVYNTNTGATEQYAMITAINGAGDTLTLSNQVFSANRAFVIFRFTGVTVAWAESNNLYARTVDRSDGSLIFPTGITGNFLVTDSGSGYTVQNPHIAADSNGNVFCVYESVEATVNIRVKKIFCDNEGTNASFVWTGIADANSSTADGLAVAVTARPDYIVKVLHDGEQGVFVLFTSHTTVSPYTKRVMVAHISGTGTATTFTITNADNPDMALVSSGVVALAYESITVSGPRVMVRRYDSSPAALGAVIDVQSVTSAYSQISPRIAPDGNGGALVSWLESRYYPSIYYTIFAQHFDSGYAVPGDQLYGDDRFAGVPVKITQSDDPYEIEHGILRYNDAADPDAGLFYWMDERAGTVGQVDIYFRNLAD